MKFGEIEIPDYGFFLGIVEERLKRLARNVDDQPPEYIADLERASDLVFEIQLHMAGRLLLGEDFWEAIAVRSFSLGNQLNALGIPWDEQKAKTVRRRQGQRGPIASRPM